MAIKIDLEKYKRRGLFEAFKDRDVPYFSTTSNVDITNLKEFVDKNGYGFFVSISFLISKSVNFIPELRHRIVNGELFEFSRVDPGYTVLLDDETFSFCDSRHFENFGEYREHANARIRDVKECPDRSIGEKHHMFLLLIYLRLALHRLCIPIMKSMDRFQSLPSANILNRGIS